MVEFWAENLTQASWEKLKQLSKKYKFIVIGGWAIYLWTGMQKSKDIDIVVDYKELLSLRSEFNLEKNERLFKYEAKLEKFDIDVYLPGYSRLSIPCEEILKSPSTVQGIKVVQAEHLLLLKQGAYSDRKGSIKGRKDQIDILNIILKSGLSLEKYSVCAKKYWHEAYLHELMNAISSFSKEDLPYIGMNEHEFSKWKKEILAKLKGL